MTAHVHVTQGGPRRPSRVAVIGAGVSGLATARALSDQGVEVCVFERGRGPGGRSAHRRADEHCFDHGAQYFTARDERFAQHVHAWVERGVVARWNGTIKAFGDDGSIRDTHSLDRYVGVPGMNAVARCLAEDLELKLKHTVTGLERSGAGWTLRTEPSAAAGLFDAVVLAMPPEQILRLLPDGSCVDVGTLPHSVPCWAAMIAFDAPVDVGFDGAFTNDEVVSWVARDSSKPGRPAGERWIVHAAPEWAASRLDADRDAIAHALLERLGRIVGTRLPRTRYLAGHRWSLSRPAEEMAIDCVWSADERLALAGDWCNGGRIEGAFLSGVAAAERIVGASFAHHSIG